MTPRAAPILLTAALLLGGCSSCKRSDEPSRDTRYAPGSDAGAASSSSARPPGLAPPRRSTLEERQRHVRLAPELCEEAGRQYNRVSGRSESDRAGIDVLSSCLRRGNNAWYACILQAKTKEAFEDCGRRLLFDPGG